MVDQLCTLGLSNVAPRLQFDLQVGRIMVGIADSKFERPIRIIDNNSVTRTQTGPAARICIISQRMNFLVKKLNFVSYSVDKQIRPYLFVTRDGSVGYNKSGYSYCGTDDQCPPAERHHCAIKSVEPTHPINNKPRSSDVYYSISRAYQDTQ